MTITLMFHLEEVEDGNVVWWIDSDDVPGFYATADEIVECRRRAVEALVELGLDTSSIVEQLDATEALDAVPTRSPHADFGGSSPGLTEGDRATVRSLVIA